MLPRFGGEGVECAHEGIAVALREPIDVLRAAQEASVAVRAAGDSLSSRISSAETLWVLASLTRGPFLPLRRD